MPHKGTPEQGFPPAQPCTHLTTGQVPLPGPGWQLEPSLVTNPVFRLHPAHTYGQGKQRATSDASALQGLSKQPLAHTVHLGPQFSRALVQKENTDAL